MGVGFFYGGCGAAVGAPGAPAAISPRHAKKKLTLSPAPIRLFDASFTLPYTAMPPRKRPKPSPQGLDPLRVSSMSKAVKGALKVLPLFESRYPCDPRPRAAIDAGRAWALGFLSVSKAREAAFAAHAAARDAIKHPCAVFAARAAGHAAATAHVAGHARHASAYAEKATAAVL